MRDGGRRKRLASHNTAIGTPHARTDYIKFFLNNLGSTSLWKTLTTYTDAAGRAVQSNRVLVAGSAVVTGNATLDDSGAEAWEANDVFHAITGRIRRRELPLVSRRLLARGLSAASAFTASGMPFHPMTRQTSNAAYLVLGEPSVSQSFSSDYGFCKESCGWHAFYDATERNLGFAPSPPGNHTIHFSFIGNSLRCPDVCSSQIAGPSATPDGVDAMIK